MPSKLLPHHIQNAVSEALQALYSAPTAGLHPTYRLAIYQALGRPSEHSPALNLLHGHLAVLTARFVLPLAHSVGIQLEDAVKLLTFAEDVLGGRSSEQDAWNIVSHYWYVVGNIYSLLRLEQEAQHHTGLLDGNNQIHWPSLMATVQEWESLSPAFTVDDLFLPATPASNDDQQSDLDPIRRICFYTHVVGESALNEALNMNFLRDLTDHSLTSISPEEATYDSFAYSKQDSAFAASVIYTTYFTQQGEADAASYRRTFWEWWLNQAIPTAWQQMQTHQ